MIELLDEAVDLAASNMKKALAHLDTELLKIRAGKAAPNMIDGITVDYYGSPTPISQVANVTVPDVRTISIQPWEKNMISPIERSIMMANIGLTPQNDGEVIRLFLPPLTEERRKELVKRVNVEGETAKIAVRSNRRDAIETIKKLQKDGLSEDAAKEAESRVQGLTDKNIEKVEEACKDREKEIMTI
ncbi:ribosome recycling factor [Taibaiella sp. KBW10]|uniref:ribosome recycling factor n=1 Tax=Taibaiella sp. KBW10 TaxID=2153357 RepID=UPI000F59055C|nr:ribosome recycling factor [Taibaiella sp. KBW10]RQO31417.1 ribosome recycling factor [Taibaiella sp. KBW10]